MVVGSTDFIGSALVLYSAVVCDDLDDVCSIISVIGSSVVADSTVVVEPNDICSNIVVSFTVEL